MATEYLTALKYNGADYSYAETEVVFDTPVQYYCFNGMKGYDNFSFTYQEAVCRAGNNWDEPAAWTNCTDSELEDRKILLKK